MAPQSGISPLQELKIQAQWKEIDKKLQHIKQKWFHKNYEKVFLNPVTQDKGKKRTEKMAEELTAMRKIRFANEREERRKFQRHKETLPPYKEDEKINLDEIRSRGPMLPVPEETLQELYQGISHNDEGRKRYLKLRNQVPLEEKFFEPITTHHEYGWDVQNRFMPCVRYGRKAVIKHNFYNRNGALKLNSPFWREPMSNGLPGFLSGA